MSNTGTWAKEKFTKRKIKKTHFLQSRIKQNNRGGDGNNINKTDINSFIELILKQKLYTGNFDQLCRENPILLKFFNKLDEGLNTLDVDKAGEYVVFNRAWEYIQKVDPDNLVAQEALLRFADIHLKLALELSINYFQEHEEYEKCSHLKKNLEFVKLLLT